MNLSTHSKLIFEKKGKKWKEGIEVLLKKNAHRDQAFPWTVGDNH